MRWILCAVIYFVSASVSANSKCESIPGRIAARVPEASVQPAWKCSDARPHAERIERPDAVAVGPGRTVGARATSYRGSPHRGR